MHLDVTPAIRLRELRERTSFIFHSKPDDPGELKRRLYANPHGFAEWFTAMTPAAADADFAEYFERRSLEEARLRLIAKGETEPVPDQMSAFRKSRALISLQLIKRFRNVRYEHRPNLRRPPSVLLCKYVADHANQTTTLAEEVLHQAAAMLETLEEAHRSGRLAHEENPTCQADVLTDRWPANLEDQQRFIGDLRELRQKLARLIEGVPLEKMRTILGDLFGERPARDVVSEYIKRYGSQVKQGSGAYLPGTGQIPAAGVMIGSVPAVARNTPPHSFFGDKQE